MSNRISAKATLNGMLKVAAGNILKLLAGITVGFLLPKLIGVTDYGYYRTFTLYSAYAGVLQFGFADGICLKFAGREYAELDRPAFRAYSRFYFLLQGVLGLVGLSVALVFFSGEARFLFGCLSCTVVTNNIITYYQIISQVTGQFGQLSVCNTLYSFVTVAFILTLWGITRFSGGVYSYRICVLMYLATSVLIIAEYIRKYKDITFGKAASLFGQRKMLGSLFLTGLPLMVSNFSSSFIANIDRQFVNVLFDMDTYAVYAFAYSMLSLIIAVTEAISTVLFPTLKKAERAALGHSYSALVAAIFILVSVCTVMYFPLSGFICWFLPAYTQALPIFRIILPGVAISSAVTIVIHNYYKVLGKSLSFFKRCVLILALSAVADYCAYKWVGTTVAISVTSVLVMVIWYCLVERLLVKKLAVKWKKNFLFMITATVGFYLISGISGWLLSMTVYLAFLSVAVALFYKDSLGTIIKTVFHRSP